MAGKFIVQKLPTLFTAHAQECKKFRALNKAGRLPYADIRRTSPSSSKAKSHGQRRPPLQNQSPSNRRLLSWAAEKGSFATQKIFVLQTLEMRKPVGAKSLRNP
jgi:hypothetical protein